MITVIKLLTLVHEPVDSLHKCTLQQMKLVLATIIHNYRTIWRKNTQLGSCCPSQLTQIRVTKFFFHMPCKLPSTSMFLLKMMMHAQNLLCMQFLAILMRWTKYWSVQFVAQYSCHSVLYIVWKKVWIFSRYTEFFEFQKLTLNITLHLKKTWEYKKTKEISVFWTQSLSIKTGRYFKALSVIYKTHSMEIWAIQKY